MSTDRFSAAKEFLNNPPPRMAPNTPAHALVVFDGWPGGIEGAVYFKALQSLENGELYSVQTLIERDSQIFVVLNEAHGDWPISLFRAYTG